MASELGFEHNILEGFWSKWTTEQQKEVVDYSHKLGVSIWFWKHSKELRTREAREEFFKMLHNLCIAGSKIDFFDHESKEVIDKINLPSGDAQVMEHLEFGREH